MAELGNALQDLGVNMGMAFDVSDETRRNLSRIVALVTNLGISEISLVSYKDQQNSAEYARTAVPLLRALVDRSHNNRFAIGVDRHIDFAAAIMARQCGATRFVFGRDILECREPQTRIKIYRKELCQ